MTRTMISTLFLIIGLAVNAINGFVVQSFDSNIKKFEGLRDIWNYTNSMVTYDSHSHPHTSLNFEEIVELYEYPMETHKVKTSDDYILTVHRIKGNKKNPNPEGKPVVFLQHGILMSSVDWILAGPERGFAFLLADAGYDVWLGNARGNTYSREHEILSDFNEDYWKFSWHEIGIYDMPAMIDHALNVTGQEKLFYVGHSQGSTTFFVMTSTFPEYNDKINAMFSLAPVAYCSRIFSPVFRFLANFHWIISDVTKFFGIYEFEPTNEFYKKFITQICKEVDPTQPICSNALFLITGFDEDQLDKYLLPAILTHIPAGASVKQLIHYAQILYSGQFRQYDYGFFENINKYGISHPPSYNLENVKTPVSLHYSVNDWLSDSMDVEKLHKELPNTIGKFRVPHNKFSHLDYLYGKDVKALLYNKIMGIMTKYKN